MIRVRVPAGGGADVINRVRAGEFAGLAVTMPLKEEAASSVDDLDAASTRLRSVNTVVGIGSGHARGLSTDGAGFVNSLFAQGIALTGAGVHLLGAGGAARSIVAALGAIDGCEVTISNRTHSAAEAAAELSGSAQAVVAQMPMRGLFRCRSNSSPRTMSSPTSSTTRSPPRCFLRRRFEGRRQLTGLECLCTRRSSNVRRGQALPQIL